MVIWVAGLSGAGKTTLCQAMWRRLKPQLPTLVMLDGDAVRAAFGDDLGFSERDRHIQIRRLQGVAKLLADQGLVVVVAAVYSPPDLLAWNRDHLPGYFEVHVDAPIELVRGRDPKQLYARAATGEVRDLVGADIPWQPPLAPDFVVDATREEAPDTLAAEVIAAIPGLAAHA